MTPNRPLEGKVAIVTGAGGGIGSKFSGALAGAGASVVLADINVAAAEKAAEGIRKAGHPAAAVQTDITSQESVANMAKVAATEFQGIDILVNVAALMAELPPLPLTEYPLDVWDRVLRVNLTGALLTIQAVKPYMKERGGGKIINISSGGAYMGGGAYGISKLALIGLTVAASRELGGLNINVNAIAPGLISTEAGDRSRPPGWAESLERVIPLKTIGDPEDMFGALIFLSSSASDWVTGQCLSVDGGWIPRL